MSKQLDQAEINRRRREYVIIAATIVAVIILTVIEVRLSRLSEELPIGNNILFFGLMNIDLMLVLLLVFLVVRNITKLFIERRRGVFGSRLKTRLVMAFVGLSLLPTGILFFVALKFMSFSFEGWFDPQVEKIFSTGNEIVQGKYEDDAEENLHFAKSMQSYIQDSGLLDPEKAGELEELIKSKRKEYALEDVRVIWRDDKQSIIATKKGVKYSEQVLIPSSDYVNRAFGGEEGSWIDPEAEGDIIRAIVPLHKGGAAGPIDAALVTQSIVGKSLFDELKANQAGYQSYWELRRMKSPLKTAHVIFLIITSLLVLFSASWFGFFIAKTLTVPLERLASATEKVAQGGLHVTIEEDGQDEMSTLARSFNRMTYRIVAGTRELESAYNSLERKNEELDQRRRYMEIVLANVAAGVISGDSEGRIISINKSAQHMFKINAPSLLGKTYTETMMPEQNKILDGLINELHNSKDGSVRRTIMLPIGGTPVHFQITLTELRSDDGDRVGLVAIFEDLTQILQAQKAIAWKEVARRIAHEIKNPLTPIQLYAERLRKRYAGKIEAQGDKVFTECIDQIIDQVRELRDLVDEFRKFARMPSAKPAPADLNEAIQEVTMLYQEAGGPVTFALSLDPAMPIFDFDREQIRRMMNNLYDNAVAAINGPGEIRVTTTFIELLQIARIEVSDTGQGIPMEDRKRIFEPDFSTKKGGSGLGLAIVQRIVSDHFGFIRVRSNTPRGSTFVIELPTYLPLLGLAAFARQKNEMKSESKDETDAPPMEKL